ncbi:hypothetical protein KJ765_04820 [Candidatus Micrarchaeota archaeon]|nr:hypothetical protein [Candidatus Micrarchaeota archaeon]
MVSKTGIASLILGLFIVVGVWFAAFQNVSVWAFVLVAVEGGLVILGLFLMFIGLLMLLL